jgi:dihydropteroate synthase
MRRPRIISTGITGIRDEMSLIGVDPVGIGIMEGKSRHLLIRMDEVDLRAALMLKQNILSIGGEAALRREAAGLTVQSTPVLLMGTVIQLRRLSEKLKSQPFGLSELGANLARLIHRVDEETRFLVGKHNLLESRQTAIMGILNVTPDSFSDGGQFLDLDKAVARGLEMMAQGADIIDVGGESTKPGSRSVELDEELDRVIPVIETLAQEGVKQISVDTTRAVVARKALEAGATVVNDISAMSFDPEMMSVVHGAEASVILMHTSGRPDKMQEKLGYTDLLGEIALYLANAIDRSLEAGILREKICIDPGIGFGKSPEQNLELIGRIAELKSYGTAVMLGASRKSFISAVASVAAVSETPGGQQQGQEQAGSNPADHNPAVSRLAGSLAAVTAAVLKGVDLVRVHDVKETAQAVSIANGIREFTQC